MLPFVLALISARATAFLSTRTPQLAPTTSCRNPSLCPLFAASIEPKQSEQTEVVEERVEQEPCNVVFTHTNADFDSLAAAVALSLLWSAQDPSKPTHVVLPRGTHPAVQRFVAFHKHLLPLRGFKTILPEDVHSIGIVDAQSASRIGRGQSWLETAQSIHVYDHHEGNDDNNNEEDEKNLLNRATEVVIDKVGSTTTLLVELLKEANITPQPHEATLFVLGIRADTGGLLYEGTTVRDAAALLWCLEKGASQVAIADFGVAKITGDTQRQILQEALGNTETHTVNGLRIASVLVESEDDQYVAGLAQVCEELLDMTNSHVFLLGATHRSSKKKKKKNEESQSQQWISLIGRATSRAAGVDLNAVMNQFGGGGHPAAAAAALRCEPATASDDAQGEPNLPVPIQELVAQANDGELSSRGVISTAVSIIENQIPEQLVASSFMVPISNVVTVKVDHTVSEAREIFDLHNLKSAPVVDDENIFRSSLKLNDIVNAMRAGRCDDKVKSMLRPGVKTVHPDTNMADLEYMLVHEGVGRIPVVEDEGVLVGLVSRTDVLRQYKLYDEGLPEYS